MKQMKPQRNQAKWKALVEHSDHSKGLLGALAAYTVFRHTSNFHRLWEELTKLYGKQPLQLAPEEFLCPALMKAFSKLAGKEMAEKLPELVAMRMEGQFSNSPWRRSYRSRQFAFYAEPVLDMMCRLILLSCYEETVKERLFCKETYFDSYDYLLALEIRRGNEEIITLIREAMLGDNSQIQLTRDMINAIVISGDEGLLEDLIRLLLAARLQEGLRQQILEAADLGSVAVLCRFLKVCIDEKLFRYSSVIRAFDVWSGMGYGDQKPAAVQKYAQLAYECLTEEAKRLEYYKSDNNVEAYFSLWAQANYEYADAYKNVGRLLDDERKYRKILGWLFVTRTDNPRYQMKQASRYLQVRDEEVLAWVVENLAVSWSVRNTNWQYSGNTAGQAISNSYLPDTIEGRKQLFFQLKEIAAYIGNRKQTFSGNPFEFVSVTLDNQRVYDCMLSLAGCDMNEELIREILKLSPNMAVNQRRTVINAFLLPETNLEHREYLKGCLNDRSVTVKELAVKRLAGCDLSANDLSALADTLRSKSSGVRSGIMAVLKKQSVESISPLIPQLLESAEEFQNQAAIELLLEHREQHPQLLRTNRAFLTQLQQRKHSTQTQILLDQLLEGEQETLLPAPENGYGLYDPRVIEDYCAGLGESAPKTGLLARLLGGKGDVLSPRQLKALLPTWEELDALLGRMDQVFVRHANEEIEILWLDGSGHKVLFGDPVHSIHLPAACGYRSLNDAGARLDMVPFWEEFREALGEYATDVTKMLGLFHLSAGGFGYRPMPEHINYSPWYVPIEMLQLAPMYHNACRNKYTRAWELLELLNHLPQLFDAHEVFTEAMQYYRSMVAVLGEENLGKEYYIHKMSLAFAYQGRDHGSVAINHRMLVTWRRAIRQLTLCDADFREWFAYQYRLERQVHTVVRDGLRTEDYFRAHHKGIIPQDILMAYLLDADSDMPGKIRVLSNPSHWPEGRKLYEQYPVTQELVPLLLDRIVAVEEKRGELPTPLTEHCLAIERFEGAEHFCNLLAALGRESFFRGYVYARNTTKKAVLSSLLKQCYPAKEDTPERLAALLKATDISDQRLVEAVMYAPQWAGFAEELLGWPGLKSGVWFFHAHINETFYAEKETETAIYSPISPQQFNDGAFDKHWFFDAYEKLGEKRFRMLYKSAKYITSGSNQHRRSQLYADAALGRLDAGELMQEITEKRNQEKLRCYPLIPIPPGDSQEALRRYEFIQQFLKESRQFGAQRRESEKKACATAMENLAITTGLMDVNRLMWQMESRKIEEIRPLMEPAVVEGISLRLTVDENGDAGIAMEKDGKALKTLPKALNKNEVYLNLKATAKELKALKSRSRESMERAMMEQVWFEPLELGNICGNPILAPMVLKLVWTDGTQNGFLRQTPEGLMLEGLDGQQSAAEKLRIAHPHDLRRNGQWTQYMHLLYEKRLVQPFKQVFREYYPITEDERQERTISRRYAGHQVQPQRTVALLKGRGWTVDYEEGLQKVFYKENLIVRMFAMADWFSPADIEAPTLETVEFFDRSTRRNVPLEEVPPILFSETMRDLDLVVSVAHVGGVDPEASHSTVEMRVAIATELVQLLKLGNVTWIGAHAKIQGTLANYSVHMGSGVVHGEGVGMISILPVHSQATGRIFLPFADDDPKTAEILSKILLLAEDQKIKDPTILSQIMA